MTAAAPDAWPTCPNCGRSAPHDTAVELRPATPVEAARLEELNGRQAGSILTVGERRYLRAARWRAKRDVPEWSITRTVKRMLPKAHWGYPIPQSTARWCTLRCAQAFAGLAYLAGYRRKEQ